MTNERCGPANRVERRRQRTRAALIKAAQGFIGDGKLNAAVLEITQAADVGMGSFYNHFDSKEELFQAALNEIFDYSARCSTTCRTWRTQPKLLLAASA